MPRLGWTMEKGRVVSWYKQVGEWVQAGEPLFSVESDKAVLDVEALESGTLYVPPDAPQPGDEVPVGNLLAYLLEPGEEAADIPAMPTAQPVTVAREVRAALPALDASPNKRAPSTPQRTRRETPAISPRARRVARELDVDWNTLQGSGRTGRIVERDIRAAAAQAARSAALPASQTMSPVVVQGVDAEVAELVALCLRLQAASRDESPRPTQLAFILKLVAQTLRDYPALLADGRGESGSEAIPVDITLAIKTPAGFVRHVVHNAAARPSYQLVAELARVMAAPPSGTADVSQSADGAGQSSLTVVDLGSYDLDRLSPGPAVGEKLVLTIGRVAPRLYRAQGETREGQFLPLDLAFRADSVDAEQAHAFLLALCDNLQAPLPLLMA